MSQTRARPCDAEPGRLRPEIDRDRCEGKSDCARVCPYGVFLVRKLEAPEKAGLGRLTRLRIWTHGGRQAFVVKGEECHACSMCVDACPERAIRLVAVASA